MNSRKKPFLIAGRQCRMVSFLRDVGTVEILQGEEAYTICCQQKDKMIKYLCKKREVRVYHKEEGYGIEEPVTEE